MKKGDIIKIAGEQALVKWVVDTEAGVLYDTGDLSVIDIKATAVEIVKESPPEYQTSVDHMTDEQLRQSIEELRTKRVFRPEVKRRASPKSEPEEKISEEEKKIMNVLANKSEAEILDLQRKLGLID